MALLALEQREQLARVKRANCSTVEPFSTVRWTDEACIVVSKTGPRPHYFLTWIIAREEWKDKLEAFGRMDEVGQIEIQYHVMDEDSDSHIHCYNLPNGTSITERLHFSYRKFLETKHLLPSRSWSPLRGIRVSNRHGLGQMCSQGLRKDLHRPG